LARGRRRRGIVDGRRIRFQVHDASVRQSPEGACDQSCWDGHEHCCSSWNNDNRVTRFEFGSLLTVT
jgi:hypothetical protein